MSPILRDAPGVYPEELEEGAPQDEVVQLRFKPNTL
jgi:hypothetical protein